MKNFNEHHLQSPHQVLLATLRQDYWHTQTKLERTKSPKVKRGLAVLAGLINSQLAEIEKGR